MFSLADTAYKHVVDAYAVFVELDEQHDSVQRSRFWSWLKPGFRHVEVWKHIPPGAWLRFDTSVEMIGVEVYADPPWILRAHLNPTVVHVRRQVPKGYWRERWFTGPITCVELSKAFLGVRGAFVRTPWQLYQFLTKGQQ